MRVLRWAAVGMIALTSTVCCSAQQKFPLKPGEWTLTSSDTGSMTLLFCLNDEMWQKALTQNPSCTIQQLQVASTGASYSMDCPMKSFQMKGTVNLTFDGMEHMTGKANVDITLNGKTTSSVASTDYRWKGATCSPDDVNIRAANAQKAQ